MFARCRLAKWKERSALLQKIDLHVLYLLVLLLVVLVPWVFLPTPTWFLAGGAAALLLFPQGIILTRTIESAKTGHSFCRYLMTHEVLTAMAGSLFGLTWFLYRGV
jgi:hypothetical protein